MNVQLSVSLWTGICFVLLMLILHNLLFKPVLGVIDARRARLEEAKRKREEHETLAKEYEAIRVQEETAYREALVRRIKKEIEEIRADNKAAMEVARDGRVNVLDECRAESEAKRVEIINTLSVHTESIATALAESIIKG